MKCISCGSEWTVSSSFIDEIKVCPFCKAPLQPKNTSLKDTLRWIVQDRGLEVFRKSELINALLADLVNEDEKGRRKIKLALSSGAGNKFYNIIRQQKKLTEFGRKEFIYILSDNGFTSDFCDFITDIFEYSIFHSSIDKTSIEKAKIFVQIKEYGTTDTYGDRIKLQVDKQYEIYMFYHPDISSNIDNNLDATKNISVSFFLPEKITPGETGTIKGKISSLNNDFSEIYDSVFIESDETYHLKYVTHSAILHIDGKLDAQALNAEELFSSKGIEIVSKYKMLPSSNPYITFRIQVENCAFHVEKLTKKETELQYTQTCEANPDDILDFRIYYHNTGKALQTDVTIFDTLPINLTYIPESMIVTKLYCNNTFFLNLKTNENKLFSDQGINIGNLKPNEEVFLSYKAKIKKSAEFNEKETLISNTVKVLSTDQISSSTIKIIVINNIENGFCEHRGEDGSVTVGTKKNGIWHGPFKKTYESGAHFEGTYVNGKCVGELTYVDDKGHTTVGLYENGNWNGKCVFENGNSILEGIRINGDWNGTFKKTYKNGAVYIGTYINNEIVGELTYIDAEGNTFVCQWQKGNWNGTGKYHSKYGILTGSWINGEVSGKAIYQYHNGSIYEGGIKNFKRNGQGIIKFFSNKIILEAYFKDDMVDGSAIIKFPGESLYKGSWKDIIEGRGTFSSTKCFGIRELTYSGEWKNGMISGKGSLTIVSNKGDSIIYDGEFALGKIHGNGFIYSINHGVKEPLLNSQWHENTLISKSTSSFIKETANLIVIAVVYIRTVTLPISIEKQNYKSTDTNTLISLDSKKNYAVELSSVGTKYTEIISIVREVTGLGLKETKDLILNVPIIIIDNITINDAQQIKEKFGAHGCVATIKKI